MVAELIDNCTTTNCANWNFSQANDSLVIVDDKGMSLAEILKTIFEVSLAFLGVIGNALVAIVISRLRRKLVGSWVGDSASTRHVVLVTLFSYIFPLIAISFTYLAISRAINHSIEARNGGKIAWQEHSDVNGVRLKGLPLHCVTHSYCARFVASLARAVSACMSRTQ